MPSSGRVDAHDAMSIVEGLEGFPGRGAGTDAERRAADWLASRCSGAGREASIETFWCRPNWALAHTWHAALGIAGSLIALASPIAGIVILAVALISVCSDAITGVSLGRRLTPERASQNVIVSLGSDERAGGEREPAQLMRPRLILTANYDAGRIGLAYNPLVRNPAMGLSRALHGAAPGRLGWLTVALAWLLAVAVVRDSVHVSQSIGAVQFVPTVALLVSAALLIDLGTGNWSPAAGDNGTGVAVLAAAADALAAVAPQNLDVEAVLSGAGDGDSIGLRRYLRAHRTTRVRQRRRTAAAESIVVGIQPCAGGTPRWWQSDGAFIPLRYSTSLRRIAERIAAEEPHLQIGRHRGRGNPGAFVARTTGLPALTIGCLDQHGLPPHSHRKSDVAAQVNRASLDSAIQFTLLLVDGIDAAVGLERSQPAVTRA